MALPNFLIIGTAKAGTTSMWYYLRQHPQIFLPDKKECHHYCAADMPASHRSEDNKYRAIESREEYESLFSSSGESVARGEVSPMYLYYPETAARIAASLPDVKLVAFLRNPADRAFSAYVHMVRDGHETLSFEDSLKAEDERINADRFHPGYYYRTWGYYYQRLRPYLDHFARDQIRLYRYDDLKTDNAAVLRGICDFLGVDSRFRFDTSVKMNTSGVPRYRWLHRYITEGLPRSSFFNVVKRPLPESWWIRSVKSVQHWNYVKPKLGAETRASLMNDYRDDLEKLSEKFDFDVSAWQAE